MRFKAPIMRIYRVIAGACVPKKRLLYEGFARKLNVITVVVDITYAWMHPSPSMWQQQRWWSSPTLSKQSKTVRGSMATIRATRNTANRPVQSVSVVAQKTNMAARWRGEGAEGGGIRRTVSTRDSRLHELHYRASLRASQQRTHDELQCDAARCAYYVVVARRNAATFQIDVDCCRAPRGGDIDRGSTVRATSHDARLNDTACEVRSRGHWKMPPNPFARFGM